jgi:hypothetical protein
LPENSVKRLQILKANLSLVERFAIEKIMDICSLKGLVIAEGAHLVSGCTYNQLNRVRSSIFKIKNYINFLATETHWPNLLEQEKFDVFIDDILLDLAKKNKNNHPNNLEQKALMFEVLNIYGADGTSLYSACAGICALEAIGNTAENQEVDDTVAMNCEKKFLDDLQQILFIAIR